MSAFRVESYRERGDVLSSVPVHIVSYKAENVFRCSVDEVGNGAVLARARGATREEAEEKALKMAGERLESRMPAGKFTMKMWR